MKYQSGKLYFQLKVQLVRILVGKSFPWSFGGQDDGFWLDKVVFNIHWVNRKWIKKFETRKVFSDCANMVKCILFQLLILKSFPNDKYVEIHW